jgi:polysaccharide biosynthesis protein PslH
MNILQLCNKPPYPPHEGGSIAMHAVTQGLLDKGLKVKVLAVSSHKNKVDHAAMPESYINATAFESVFVDLNIKILPAFFNLFTSASYHVKRFVSRDFENKIIEILQHQEFDIIQLETVFLTPYIKTIRKFSGAKIVLRAHNVEHLIWLRMAGESKNPLKRFYLRHLAKTLKKYEEDIINDVDGIAAITPVDVMHFINMGCIKPVIDMPFGISLNDYKITTNSQGNSLFHIGSMNWMPNINGIMWFLEEVWMQLIQEFADIKLSLAGRAMPASLMASSYPNVVIVGEVADAKTFMESKSIMIVPLFSGSGIRIKIIEAMAMGKIVIATAIAAEGIHYTADENIIIANTAQEFKTAITDIVTNKEKQSGIALNARRLIENEYNNDIFIDKLIQLYQQIVKEIII